MPEARFLKLIVVSLLLLNLGTLGYLWFNRQHDRPHPPFPHERHEGGPARFLREKLQLSDEQETTFRHQREAHHETVMSIRDEMRESKRQLYALMQQSDTALARTTAIRWLDSLAAQQRRIELVTYEHFKDVRGICAPEQQKKFDEVIGEALEQMR